MRALRFLLQLEGSVRENEQLMCENELFAAYLSRHASVRHAAVRMASRELAAVAPAKPALCTGR